MPERSSDRLARRGRLVSRQLPLNARTPLEALTPPPEWEVPGTSEVASSAPRGPRLLDRVRDAIRVLHYSPRTEKAYIYWTRRFVFHYGRARHPADMGGDEVRCFLSHLAVNEHVSASTQNQALCALVFLYRRVLGRDLESLDSLERAKAPRRVPVVLTRAEVRAVLEHMSGVPRLVCWLLYGTGLRLMECLSLRVKDVDFERNELTVRDGKGAKDRVTLLPTAVRQALLDHVEAVRQLHHKDLARGRGRVPLPGALAEKYPGAAAQWTWQHVFPASSFYTDPRTRILHRHHLHETVVQKAMAQAVRLARITKPATPHALRPLLRHPSPRGRLRPTDHSGAAGPQRHQHDHDLHPRPQPRRAWRAKPRRSPVTQPGGRARRRNPEADVIQTRPTWLRSLCPRHSKQLQP